MGKKGSWFSTIIRAFIPSSKEKLEKDLVNKSKKVKKKGRGNLLGNGETKSFIPFFRQPSSIEKILEEADKNNLFRPNTTFLGEQETTSSLPLRPSSSSSISLIVTSPPANSPPRHEEISNNRLEPKLKDHQFSAIRIQAAYRGYMARKSFRTMKGLLRLQRVMKGQHVKRQISHAIKQMQLSVRAQTQVHTRRIQSQLNYNNNMDKESETTFSKSSFNQLVSEAGEREEWDNGLINSNEAEGKMQKKVEAVMKRERAMAYGYSNQLWKSNPKSAQLNPTKTRPGSYPGGYPMWWNRMQHNLPSSNRTDQPAESINQTPAQQTQPSNNMTHNIGLSNQDSCSTKSKMSTKSTPPLSRTRRPLFTSNKTPPTPSSTSSNIPKYSRARTLDALMKDDDSLASCPPFSVQPNYMAPTISTMAKSRGVGEPKRRFSLPLSSNIGSLRWNNKGVSSKGSSVNSVTSMPAAFGRKPFNLYV